MLAGLQVRHSYIKAQGGIDRIQQHAQENKTLSTYPVSLYPGKLSTLMCAYLLFTRGRLRFLKDIKIVCLC